MACSADIFFIDSVAVTVSPKIVVKLFSDHLNASLRIFLKLIQMIVANSDSSRLY